MANKKYGFQEHNDTQCNQIKLTENVGNSFFVNVLTKGKEVWIIFIYFKNLLSQHYERLFLLIVPISLL